MNNKKYLKKILVLCVVIFVALSTLIIFVFLDIKHKNENIFALESELDNKSEKNDYLLSIQKVVQNSDDSINKINNSILASDGDVTVIEKIENLAKNRGMDIEIESLSIDAIPSSKDKNIVSLDIKAKTTGTWVNTYDFLSEIEALPYVVRVEKIVLNSSNDNAQSKLLSSYPKWQSIFEIRLLKYK